MENEHFVMLTNANLFHFIFCKFKIRNKLTLSRTHRGSSGYNMVIFSNGTIMKSAINDHSSFSPKFSPWFAASALIFFNKMKSVGWGQNFEKTDNGILKKQW